MKAGRNTPQSVLSYIDAILQRNQPIDPNTLAQELGYTPKQIRKLKEKHGEGLLIHLKRVKRRRQEEPRFMAKQNGMLHPPQYVSTVHGAIDDAESPPEEVTAEYSRTAWETFEVVKGEELARKQTRSRLERLRQAEIQLRKQGKPAEHHIAQIEEALVAMEREAKAA